ncbi:hypothetical protein ACFLZT_04925 [Thermodesulfobacteriota bacterium]
MGVGATAPNAKTGMNKPAFISIDLHAGSRIDKGKGHDLTSPKFDKTGWIAWIFRWNQYLHKEFIRIHYTTGW